MSTDELKTSEPGERPGYYAVIPAVVRYDESISSSAKLLYGEISALANKEGYCYASNRYFEKLYHISKRSVQAQLQALKKRGFIRIEDGSGGAETRRIYCGIMHTENLTEARKSNAENYMGRDEDEENFTAPDEENVTHNNIIINNTPLPPTGGKRARRKRNEPKTVPDWNPERFDGFWNYYPKSAHKNKQAAIKAWDKLKPSDELIDEIAEALRRQVATDLWTRGIGIPYPATYLNQRRWEDEIEDETIDEDDGPPWW